MNITCPDCAFSRDVDKEDLPPRTVIANCPRCGCRFRFSPTEGVLEKIADGDPERIAETEAIEREETSEEVQKPREDDPLPKGAIVVDPKKRDERWDERDDERPENGRAQRKQPIFQGISHALGAGNPWAEAQDSADFLVAFYQTILRVCLQAQLFFRGLRPQASFTRPLLFFLVITVIEFFANFAWMTLFRQAIGDASDPQLAAVLALFAPQGNVLLLLLLQTALSTLKLYILSAIFYSVYRLISGKQPSYSCIFQVVSYSAAPAVLAIVPLVGSLVGAVWAFACLAIGLRQVLSLSWSKTALGFLPLVILYALFLHYVVLA